jgi:hypothetical protein
MTWLAVPFRHVAVPLFSKNTWNWPVAPGPVV